MKIHYLSHLYVILDVLMPNTFRYSRVRASLARKLVKAVLGAETSIYRGVDFGHPPSGLIAGTGCLFNRRCVFETQEGNASINIGDNVWFGHEVLVTVGSHLFGPSSQRAGGGYTVLL